jgi:hypothetical protein
MSLNVLIFLTWLRKAQTDKHLLAVVGEPPTNEKEYIEQNTSQTKH